MDLESVILFSFFMPNYTSGTDEGTLQSHPLFDSPFNSQAGGPYKLTYNNFVRPNTGVYDNDGTADSARNAWHYYLQNLDITVSKYDCSAEATANKVVLRDSNGNINVTGVSFGSYVLSDTGLTGVVGGGHF